jgi:hypothetical protein
MEMFQRPLAFSRLLPLKPADVGHGLLGRVLRRPVRKQTRASPGHPGFRLGEIATTTSG